MKYLKYLALSVLLASAQFAYSDSACDPCNVATEYDLCNMTFCDVEFELYADALYWHMHNNSDFSSSIDSSTANSGYSWGWRVGASAYWNNWDLGLRYTSFSPKGTLNLGTISYSQAFDYDVFDLELGRASCLCEGILFRPFIGAKFAEIKTYYTGQTEEFSIQAKQKVDGAGLYIGFDNRWQLCSFTVCDSSVPVALVSRFSTGVLDAEFKYYDDEGTLGFKDHHFVPVHEVYAGLEFRFCGLCNADAFFQAGYEAQYWGWSFGAQGGNFIAIPATHLGVGGLVLRFGANF